MTSEVKALITNAIYEVYRGTTETYNKQTCSKVIAYSVPGRLGASPETLKIVRNSGENLTYELYLFEDMKTPFLSVFGCWPIGFVADIFIRTLEHYHDWY